MCLCLVSEARGTCQKPATWVPFLPLIDLSAVTFLLIVLDVTVDFLSLEDLG